MIIHYKGVRNDLMLRGRHMKNTVVFINPNNTQDIERYLPKILAEAIINKVTRDGEIREQQYDAKQRSEYK